MEEAMVGRLSALDDVFREKELIRLVSGVRLFLHLRCLSELYMELWGSVATFRPSLALRPSVGGRHPPRSLCFALSSPRVSGSRCNKEREHFKFANIHAHQLSTTL